MAASPAPEMLIIADDLSGAADCGIACKKAGLDTIVVLGDAAVHIRAEAVAIDADTRRWPLVEAAAETARLVRAHARPGQILFKKLDSTLRGNIGPELAAALQARRQMHGPAVAVVAPAYPATGRTTAAGYQLLHGVKLEHTDVWKAEAIAGCAHIPAMLQSCGLRAAAIALDRVRDTMGFAHVLEEASHGHDAIVCDAETDADLARIAIASIQLGRNTLWVGSAGLAHHLPHAAGLQRAGKQATIQVVDRPVLTIVGSASGVSRQQVKQLINHPGLRLICVQPDILQNGDWTASQAALRCAFDQGRDAALVIDERSNVNLAQGYLLARAMAELVVPFVSQVGALVMTGGETARAVLQSLSIAGLRLIGEIEAGVPVSITEAGLTVITKAGAFGSPGTLLTCQRALRPASTSVE